MDLVIMGWTRDDDVAGADVFGWKGLMGKGKNKSEGKGLHGDGNWDEGD
jgi:hypothetical protein